VKYQLDLKSLLVGVLSTLLFISLISAKQSEEGWGDVSVSSLTIRDGGSVRILSPAGENTVLISGSGNAGGTIVLKNALGATSVSLGANREGHGGFVTYNDGKVSAHLGTGEMGGGYLRTFDKREAVTTYIGTNSQGGGQVTAYNEVGSETIFLGTGTSGNGFLRTANEYGKMSAYIGTAKSNTGMVLLCDREGFTQWAKKIDL